MKERQLEKLMERFVRPYQVKGIISANAIELDLSTIVKIHPVININRVYKYKEQVNRQRKKQPALIVIKGEKEYEVEKILNKKKFRGKDRYLVQWKGYMVEENTWEPKKNLGNIKELVKEFEEEYSGNIGQSKKITEEKIRGELPGRYMAKMLYRQNNKRFDQEYQGQLERN